MKNINRIQNKRSNNVSSGLPSNPSPSDIMYGELAINYHNGIETIFTKNDTNSVVGFSSDDYYTSKKLGSGFTNENSANTVTSVIERNEKVTSAALNKLNTSIESVSSITDAHISNGNIHVTSSDKEYWDEKAISSDGGDTADRASSMPFGRIDSSSTNAVLLVNGVSGITELKDGVFFFGYNPSFTPTSASTLNVNGLGAKYMVASNANNTRSAIWTSGTTYMLIYDESKENGNGAWVVSYGFNSNSDTIGYDVREYYNGGKTTKTNLYRYQICLSCFDGTLLPVNEVNNSTATTKTLTSESFNPFGQIYYYGTTTTVASGGTIPSAYLWVQSTYGRPDFRYSFNIGTTLVPGSDIYLVCVPQQDGSVKLHTSPLAFSLPNSNDGLVYKRLGKAIKGYLVALELDKPCYCYKNGMVVPYTSKSIDTDGVLDETTSASTNPIQTQAVFNVIAENEEITAAALNDLNDALDSLSDVVDENEEITSSALNDLNGMIGGIERYWKNVEDSAITYDNVVDMLNYNIQYVKDNFVRKPVVLYQTDGTSGLLGANNGTMDLTTWQLENLDFSPYKYVMAYFKQADLAANSLTATPAVTVCIVLDDASLSSQYSAYIGGGGATNMNDRDIHFCVLCAIDSTKTKFKVLSEHSIAGTILGERNVNGRYCYKIEGHY